ncbi:MAG: hypothetical protein ACYST3_07210 [Planctomycetota bacterium]|jgi:hypothetical protein
MICPIRKDTHGLSDECKEKKCAWWTAYDKCAIVSIAISIESFNDNYDNIHNNPYRS